MNPSQIMMSPLAMNPLRIFKGDYVFLKHPQKKYQTVASVYNNN